MSFQTAIPPLVTGQRLTRAEFERRYEAMPYLKRAELIDGVVYLPASGGIQQESRARVRLTGWLGYFEAFTPGVVGGNNSTIRLDANNEPQPCALLMLEPALGGQAGIDADDFVAGAPELIAEIASSDVHYDLHTKLHVYRRAGVCEYLVWRVLEKEFEWFVARRGHFEPMQVDAAGYLKSQVFPGLWLDPAALVNRDLPGMMAVLRQGLQSAEHAAFVARSEGRR